MCVNGLRAHVIGLAGPGDEGLVVRFLATAPGNGSRLDLGDGSGLQSLGVGALEHVDRRVRFWRLAFDAVLTDPGGRRIGQVRIAVPPLPAG